MARGKNRSAGNGRPKNTGPKKPGERRTEAQQGAKEPITREECLNRMPEALRPHTEAIFEQDNASDKHEVLAVYEIGVHAAAIKQAVTQDGGGTVAMKLVGKLLDRGPSFLYAAAQFASLFSEEEVETFQARRMPDGRHPTWNHFKAVLSVANKHQRHFFLEDALTKGLSSTELAAEVNKQKNKNRGQTSSGASVPKRLDGYVKKFRTWTDHWLSGEDNLCSPDSSPFQDKAKALPVKDMTSEKREELAKLKEDLDHLAVLAKKRAKDIEGAIKVIDHHMEG